MRGFTLTGSPALQISSWNALTSVRVIVRGYCRDLEGLVRPFEFSHVPNTNRTINSTIEQLAEGELMNVTAFITGAAPIVGQTFLRLQVLHGRDASAIVLGTLAADYVTAVQPLAFPGSPVKRSVDGPGAIRSITGTNPSAGIECIETVPTGARWRPRSVFCQLVADGTAANREVTLTFDDGTTVYAIVPSYQAQIASATWSYTWGAHLAKQTIAQTNAQNNGLPAIVSLAGHRIRTVTTNFQAGDNWFAPQLLVEEWLEGAA